MLLFSSLLDNWETMMDFVSNSISNHVLTMDITKEIVMNEEFRRNEQRVVNESQTLVIEKKEERGRSKSGELHNKNDKSRGKSES